MAGVRNGVFGSQFEFSHRLENIDEICEHLKNQTEHRPTIGIICGSGLSALGDTLENKDTFPYEKIKDFPVSTVPGHTGQLLFGKLEGKTVVMMQGRSHLYEGYTPGQITIPVRVMVNLGIKTLIVTNAAGGLNQDWNVGDVMVIKDHINLAGLAGESPLRGPNDERLGHRFPALSDAYHRDLRKLTLDIGKQLGYNSFIREGIYVAQVGPAFETPAECRFLKMIGGDAIGMSTVHEVTVARHSGLRVLGLSLITNIAVLGYGDSEAHANHAEVLEAGKMRAKDIQKLVSTVVAKMSD